MMADNIMKILDLLKPLRNNNIKDSNAFLKSLELDDRLTWELLAKYANRRVINEQAIMYLSENFETLLQLKEEEKES